MAWKYCNTCNEVMTEADLQVHCRTCRNFFRWSDEVLRESLHGFIGPQYVYAWVELPHSPDTRHEIAFREELIDLRDGGEIFYIGRGDLRRVRDQTDRNEHAIAKRDHLMQWRSFAVNILGGGKSKYAKELEETLIRDLAPLLNQQFWNQ